MSKSATPAPLAQKGLARIAVPLWPFLMAGWRQLVRIPTKEGLWNLVVLRFGFLQPEDVRGEAVDLVLKSSPARRPFTFQLISRMRRRMSGGRSIRPRGRALSSDPWARSVSPVWYKWFK